MALAAPVGVLAFWAVRGLLAGSARAGALVADTGGLVVPAVNTAALAVVAALVAVAAVLPLAYLTARHSSRLAGAANAVVVGGFALPGLVVALALAFWTLQAPWPLAALYQTQALLVFAYVVHFGSQALRAGQVAVAAVPGRLDDAARTLGAGRLRRLRTVELPLAAPGIVTAAIAMLFNADQGVKFGIVVGVALIVNHTMACVTGVFVPFVMKSLGFDPAQSATIFATTVTDIVGFFCLLGLAWLFLG